ncbi:hypothetical protein MRX96_020572 [Rhipicephalus microplus]
MGRRFCGSWFVPSGAAFADVIARTQSSVTVMICDTGAQNATTAVAAEPSERARSVLTLACISRTSWTALTLCPSEVSDECGHPFVEGHPAG